MKTYGAARVGRSRAIRLTYKANSRLLHPEPTWLLACFWGTAWIFARYICNGPAAAADGAGYVVLDAADAPSFELKPSLVDEPSSIDVL